MMNTGRTFRGLAFLGVLSLLVAGLGACTGADGTPLPTSTPVDLSVIQTQAIQTYVAEMTASAPTATETPSPTPTPQATDTPTITPTEIPTIVSTRVPVSELMKSYIAYFLTYPVDTATQCNFYVLPYIAYPYVKRTGDYDTDIRNALAVQLSLKDVTYGNLNNYLGLSTLHYEGSTIIGNELHVYFSGSLFVYGAEGYCKDRQTDYQIWAAVRQGKETLAKAGITDVVIWMDNQLLDDLLLYDLPAINQP